MLQCPSHANPFSSLHAPIITRGANLESDTALSWQDHGCYRGGGGNGELPHCSEVLSAALERNLGKLKNKQLHVDKVPKRLE